MRCRASAYFSSFFAMSEKKTFVIAGPCSVESREQLFSIVNTLSAIPQVGMIRCGVWKPRTRPGGFEGLGEEALRWIRELRADHGFDHVRFACEVARPEHVSMALKYGVDAVWVGARTTANPFLVQELAEALSGSRVAVMVKNAPNPDVKLWMGAIERFLKVGIADVRAVHRGFDVYKNSGYRNAPLWEAPIELRRAMPQVPIICDPSHIAGRKEPLQQLSQTALDLGFDGLMLEVHPSPSTALTDADQQLCPSDFEVLLRSLVLRSTDELVADEELRVLRGKIDQIDEQLLQLLVERLNVSSQIADVKERCNMAVFQPKRWDWVLQQRQELASQMGLDSEFVKEIFEKIHAESVRTQQEILNG